MSSSASAMSSQPDDAPELIQKPEALSLHDKDEYIEIYPPYVDLDEAPFWQEVTAFNEMPQNLVDEYYGQYVAVYQGNIVDADPDEGELALRFYRTFGYVPVYIHKVGVEDGLIDPEALS